MPTYSDYYYHREPLTAFDVCDACGAQARVSVLVDFDKEVELLFCKHHFMKHSEKLIEKNYTVYKQYDGLED